MTAAEPPQRIAHAGRPGAMMGPYPTRRAPCAPLPEDLAMSPFKVSTRLVLALLLGAGWAHRRRGRRAGPADAGTEDP